MRTLEVSAPFDEFRCLGGPLDRAYLALAASPLSAQCRRRGQRERVQSCHYVGLPQCSNRRRPAGIADSSRREPGPLADAVGSREASASEKSVGPVLVRSAANLPSPGVRYRERRSDGQCPVWRGQKGPRMTAMGRVRKFSNRTVPSAAAPAADVHRPSRNCLQADSGQQRDGRLCRSRPLHHGSFAATEESIVAIQASVAGTLRGTP